MLTETCQLWASCEVFFCTPPVKTLMCCSCSVSILSVLMTHHQHCNNTKTSNVDNCVCLNLCVTFSFWGFHDNHSSLLITFTNWTCYIMNLHTFTYHSHTNTISFTTNNSRNSRQMWSLHMTVSRIIDKNMKRTIDVKIATINNMWNTLNNDYFVD